MPEVTVPKSPASPTRMESAMRSYTMVLAVVMVAFSAAAPAMAQSESPSYAAYMTTDHNMRSSKLIGLPVYNDHGDKIGVIDDILMPAKGGADTAVVSVGGFLGIGAKLIIIPLSHVQFTSSKLMMMGDGSKTALMAMPSYSYSGGSSGG
ncbi:MAG TPA: PRC-barrel domain-containing protein [Acetobacteraceae bacterium]|nr:PRC-barrel domain-containing protein [Acetobacteraceae bacterium]